ncbi:MAG: hypothetical protein Q8O40_11115 [Chloroflexota bacterium]|nr:hypothetical protein [Chloroflexota bacterium]
MVRNYDSPAPTRVVANIKRVLEKQDMTLLEKGSYDLLITHCGFIAHYSHAGFIGTYKDDMPAFVAQFLDQRLIGGWYNYLQNPRTYLYDVSYKGKLLADIVRELIPIFEAYKPAIEAAHALHTKMDAEARLHGLAKQLGYEVVKVEERR